jgi:DNA-binding transcriptional LysR family regulator
MALHRLDQMTLFARVVEAGSFAAAASSLGQTRAAVSKQIAALEERLGVALLNRTTRRMRLTEIGRDYYRRCAAIAEEIDAAELEVASVQGRPRGWLRIAAPVTFGRRYLGPLIEPFSRSYPDVAVDVTLSDEAADLIAEGFDVGIQVTATPDSDLVAQPLAESRMVVCAAPSYFARHGVPGSPGELDRHNCLVYSKLGTPRLWRFLPNETIRVSGNFAVNHGETLLIATLDGLGIAYMPTFIAGPYLAEGRLEAVLKGQVRSSQRIFALYPRNRNPPPKVRAFVDFLRRTFTGSPMWDDFERPE